MKFKSNEEIGSSGEGLFVKLKDGESVEGIFLGEPYEFNVVWENKKTSVVPFGTGKFRFRLNFAQSVGADHFDMKIFENGSVVYEQLAEINKEYPIEDTFIKISRKGEKLDTVYSVLPLRKQVTEKIKKQLSELKLHSLKHEDKETAPKKDDNPPQDMWPPEDVETKLFGDDKDKLQKYIVPFGRNSGKRLIDIPYKEAKEYADWIIDSAEKEKREITGKVAEYCEMVIVYSSQAGRSL